MCVEGMDCDVFMISSQSGALMCQSLDAYAVQYSLLLQGSVVLRMKHKRVVKHLDDGTPVEREVSQPTVCHNDIIGSAFWEQHPELLV